MMFSLKIVRIRSYSGPHFPAFGLNTERYGENEDCGKMRSRITPKTDTFHAVMISVKEDERLITLKHSKILQLILAIIKKIIRKEKNSGKSYQIWKQAR